MPSESGGSTISVPEIPPPAIVPGSTNPTSSFRRYLHRLQRFSSHHVHRVFEKLGMVVFPRRLLRSPVAGVANGTEPISSSRRCVLRVRSSVYPYLQPLLTRSSLVVIVILVLGFAISYGLWSRQRDKDEVENHGAKSR